MPFDPDLAENRAGRIGIDNQYRSFRRSFVAAADGTIPDAAPIESSGLVTAIAFKPDAEDPPDGLTVSLMDSDDFAMITPEIFGPEGGRVAINPPQQFDTLCSILVAGNTTPGAKGTIIVYAM